MLEVGAARAFRAVHRIPVKAPGGEPALERHEHDYRVETVVRGETLPDSGMLIDLDDLNAALAACLDQLDGADLDALPAFAGRLATIEIVAEHVWGQLRGRMARAGPLHSLRVTVHESEDAWASVDRPLRG